MLNKEPTSTSGKTLREIVESDIGKTTNLSVVTMVARSGSGKTATVVELAKSRFVIYCVCVEGCSLSFPDFKDLNFVNLAWDVEEICARIPKPGPASSLHDLVKYDATLKRQVGYRIEREFLARMLFLQHLFNNNPDLEPLQFFREQTTGGAITIQTRVDMLHDYGTETISLMHSEVHNKLARYLAERRQGLVIALDRAHVAESRILYRQFIAPSSLSGNRNILDGRNQVQKMHRRGFLTPLCETLSKMRATLVILGTSLTLQDADQVYAAVGERTNFHKIVRFPVYNHRDDVEQILSELIDISDCTIPHDMLRKLTGRARFSVSVVDELFERYRIASYSKQDRLEQAFESAIELAKTGLKHKVQRLLNNDVTGEVVHLLGRMVVAFKFQGGKIWFANETQVDFIDSALCDMRIHSDGVQWLMDEPIVVEVVEEELQKLNVDPRLLENLHHLNEIIGHLGGVESAANDNAFEPLV
ncbi:hypothetical protein BG004_000104 [Podila humilis]|nr:hypothetical protein BG004_000104 [Podila humilis]